MSVTVSGLSHHASPIELRERMAFPEDSLRAALRNLKRRRAGGAVLLSTCNRVELYLSGVDDPETLHAAARSFLAEWHKVAETDFAPYLYEYKDTETVAHLFRVAASLDSMVVGEGQILGQVQDAFLAAQAEETTDKVLNTLFQRAFKVAKEVRTRSNISVGRVSVSSVAVDLAVSIFRELNDKTVLVIGSGDTAELTLKSLIERGAGRVLVANRTVERAQDLARAFRGEALALADIEKHLARADIVISATASEEPVLGVRAFQHALRERAKAPMFVIDIAVPRDIEESVNQLDNIYLYDIDDLQEVADQNLEARRAELAFCLEIVSRHVDQFIRWERALLAQPTIVSMAQELNAIRERELNKTLQSHPEFSDAQRAEIEYLTKRIVNTILQRPMSQLKREVASEDSHRVLHLVKRLFGLEDSV